MPTIKDTPSTADTADNGRGDAFLPASAVMARYSVSDMSIWRWLHDPALQFPQPIRIHRRRFWRLSDLHAWEAKRADASSPEAA